MTGQQWRFWREITLQEKGGFLTPKITCMECNICGKRVNDTYVGRYSFLPDYNNVAMEVHELKHTIERLTNTEISIERT